MERSFTGLLAVRLDAAVVGAGHRPQRKDLPRMSMEEPVDDPSGWPSTSIELQYSACELSGWRQRGSGLSHESSHRPSCNGLSGESMRYWAKR